MQSVQPIALHANVFECDGFLCMQVYIVTMYVTNPTNVYKWSLSINLTTAFSEAGDQPEV